MLPIVIAFLLLAVTAAALARGSSLLMGRMVGKTIHGRHTAAESILATGKVPPEWWKRIRRRPGDGERVRRLLLLRLGDLQKYLNAAPVFEDEESRRFVTGELDRIREQWRTADMERLMAPDGTPDDDA